MKFSIALLALLSADAFAYPSCVPEKVRNVACQFSYVGKFSREETGHLGIGRVLTMKQAEGRPPCKTIGPIDDPIFARVSAASRNPLMGKIKVDNATAKTYEITFETLAPQLEEPDQEPFLTDFSPVSIPYDHDSAQVVHFTEGGVAREATMTCTADDDLIVSPKEVRLAGKEAEHAYAAMANVAEVAVPSLNQRVRAGKLLTCTKTLASEPVFQCRLSVVATGIE